jgi:hypothetical protein
MLGFASFAEVPFAVAKTSAILALSVSEILVANDAYGSALITDVSLVDSAAYLAENDGQRGLFFTIEELTDYEAVLPTQVTFAAQVIDGANLLATMPTIATYNVPVEDQGTFIDAYPTAVVYNVPLVDGFSLYDELFGRKLWEQIEDAENANWTQINSAQATTWNTINVSQFPSWTDITDV